MQNVLGSLKDFNINRRNRKNKKVNPEGVE